MSTPNPSAPSEGRDKKYDPVPQKKAAEPSLVERVLTAAKASAEFSYNTLRDVLLPHKKRATTELVHGKTLDPYDQERAAVAMQRIEGCQKLLA